MLFSTISPFPDSNDDVDLQGNNGRERRENERERNDNWLVREHGRSCWGIKGGKFFFFFLGIFFFFFFRNNIIIIIIILFCFVFFFFFFFRIKV